MLKRLLQFLIVTLFLIVPILNDAQEEVSIYQKARIHYTNSDEIRSLLKNGIAIDHGVKRSKKYIESVFPQLELETAKQLGFKVDVLIPNMEQHILERNNFKKSTIKNTSCPNTTIDYQTPINFEVKSSTQFGGFYTYSEVLQELDDMRSLYPNLISQRANIQNFSTEEGRPIEWVRISDNPDNDESESEILYTSLHHAREPASMQQLIFFMWYILENYATDASIKALVDNTELYFIPVVNPDGYVYNQTTNPGGGGFWRKNRRNNGNGTFGVDNNRNYDYYINGNSSNGTWGGAGSSPITSSEIYHGTAPFSEVENQAVKWFVEQHDFKIALNNHTFGELIYFPFGYADVATPDEDVYNALLRTYTQQNEYEPTRDFPFAGDSDDFMYGTVGTHNKIIAMTPEIGDDFWPPQSTIEAICKEMMFFNLNMAHSVNNHAIAFDTEAPILNATTGTLNYEIQRLGLEGSGNFTVSILPVSSNISITGTANTHNGLNLLQKATGTVSYTSNASIGETITYKIVIDNGIYPIEMEVSKVLGPAEVAIDDPGNNLTNWNTSSWNTTTSEFVSAPSSITDSPSGNYGNNQNNSIEITDSIDLSDAGIAIATFNAKWGIEAGFDYVQFEVSTNNGASWEAQCGNYTRTGNSIQGINGQPMYDGVQDAWIQESIDLSEYLGETIKVRFQLVSDQSATADGFYFDDFNISTISEASLSNETFDKLGVKLYPNPISDKLTVYFPNMASANLKLYSITGQLVKEEKIENHLTDIDLKTLNPGIYIVQLQTEKAKGVYKIIKQ